MNIARLNTKDVKEVRKQSDNHIGRSRQDIPESYEDGSVKFVRRMGRQARAVLHQRQNPDREDVPSGSGMNDIYCMRCRKKTPTIGAKTIVSNKRKMIKGKCACGCKKNKFAK